MKIKQFLRSLPFYNLYKKYREEKDAIEWLKSGRPSPVPHLIKQLTIREYAQEFNLTTLIETGTFMGDMVLAMKNYFSKIVSIELSPQLAQGAKKRLANFSHIQIINGESSEVLPEILASTTDEPILFWLDAHYSGGFTAKDQVETPILKELEHIFSQSCNHVILVDDARCFTGENDYPTLEQLKDFVAKHKPNFKVDVKEDIIRIFPNT